MHLVVLLKTEVAQARRCIKSHLLIFVEGDVFIAAHFPISPLFLNFLLFAVDQLLDLLVLSVNFDYPSVADTFGISILCSSPSEVLVNCADLCGWSEDERIFSMTIATRYCLALFLLISWSFNCERRLAIHVWLDRAIDAFLIFHGILSVGHDGGCWRLCASRLMVKAVSQSCTTSGTLWIRQWNTTRISRFCGIVGKWPTIPCHKVDQVMQLHGCFTSDHSLRLFYVRCRHLLRNPWPSILPVLPNSAFSMHDS